MMYPGLKIESRIARVAKHGFAYVDIWDWRTKDLDELERQLKKNRVKLNSFGGHRDNSTSKASEKAGFLKELRASLDVAQRLECENLMVFSDGLMPAIPGTNPPIMPAKLNQVSDGEKMRNMADAFGAASDLAERAGVTLLVEALNEIDHPDYFLCKSRRTLELLRKVRSKKMQMLYDIYHMQRSEGDIIHTLTENLDHVGYIHFADSPGRTEPGTGELELANILKALDSKGYDRGFGFEYRPLDSDDRTLEDVKRIISPYLD